LRASGAKLRNKYMAAIDLEMKHKKVNNLSLEKSFITGVCFFALKKSPY
jgi:hypothetical protein